MKKRTNGRSSAGGSGSPAAGAGFTLMEVMTAIVVVSLGALAVAGSMMAVISANTKSAEQTRATALAVQELEELKAMPATDVDDLPPQQIDATGQPDPDGAYTRWVEVTDESEGATENTKEVTVVVTYRAGARGQKTAEVFTILYADDG